MSEHKWDDPAKLRHVTFYLADVALLWYYNDEADIPTLPILKTFIANVFGRPAMR